MPVLVTGNLPGNGVLRPVLRFIFKKIAEKFLQMNM